MRIVCASTVWASPQSYGHGFCARLAVTPVTFYLAIEDSLGEKLFLGLRLIMSAPDAVPFKFPGTSGACSRTRYCLH
jgi:hypothetical protein